MKEQLEIPVDVKWTPSMVAKFSLISTSIGIISGGLGLGGGIIITPLLFSTGQPPSVASLTSVYIIFYTSISSTAQFMVNGSLIYDYALFNGGFVFAGALAGLWGIQRWVARSGKQSLLLFLLTGISFLALSMIMVVSGIKLKNDLQEGKEILAFGELCPS